VHSRAKDVETVFFECLAQFALSQAPSVPDCIICTCSCAAVCVCAYCIFLSAREIFNEEDASDGAVQCGTCSSRVMVTRNKTNNRCCDVPTDTQDGYYIILFRRPCRGLYYIILYRTIYHDLVSFS